MGLDEFLMLVILVFCICSLMKKLDIVKMEEYVNCVFLECLIMEEVIEF